MKSLKSELKEALGNIYRIEIAEGGKDALDLIAELLDGYEIPLIISDTRPLAKILLIKFWNGLSGPFHKKKKF
ncbi:hypothetical protein QUB70_20605, partial [Microcoleus sp. A003_D6]